MLMPLGVFLPADLLLSRECCQAGDLLEIDRKLYAHWVVYVGNNEVVHVPETKKNEVVVEKCLLESVAHDCLVRINNKQVPAKDREVSELPGQTVVARALSCVGSTVRYNFVVSNSEHFVTWMKYGVGWSDQAKAMRHSMSSLSPTPSPRQVEKAHVDIWSEIHNILTTSTPSSPSSPPPHLPSPSPHLPSPPPPHLPSPPLREDHSLPKDLDYAWCTSAHSVACIVSPGVRVTDSHSSVSCSCHCMKEHWGDGDGDTWFSRCQHAISRGVTFEPAGLCYRDCGVRFHLTWKTNEQNFNTKHRLENKEKNALEVL